VVTFCPMAGRTRRTRPANTQIAHTTRDLLINIMGSPAEGDSRTKISS
jgi:hypothetical protein